MLAERATAADHQQPAALVQPVGVHEAGEVVVGGRGDGGQNERGPDFSEKLGVLRTQELIATYQNQVLTAAQQVQTALRAFLRDKLGFPAHDLGDGWLIFDLPEAESELVAGYMVEYGIERVWRDMRLNRIGAGTDEIMLDVIGRSYGL